MHPAKCQNMGITTDTDGSQVRYMKAAGRVACAALCGHPPRSCRSVDTGFSERRHHSAAPVYPRGECVPPRVLSSCQRATYSADSLHGVFYLEKMPIRGENGEGAIVTVGDKGRRRVLEGDKVWPWSSRGLRARACKRGTSRSGRPFTVGERRVAIRLLTSTKRVMVPACGVQPGRANIRLSPNATPPQRFTSCS